MFWLLVQVWCSESLVLVFIVEVEVEVEIMPVCGEIQETQSLFRTSRWSAVNFINVALLLTVVDLLDSTFSHSAIHCPFEEANPLK